MKNLSWALVALTCCCAFGIGGFAVGAYMQFLHAFAMNQDLLVRDITTAKTAARNDIPQLMEWMKTDVPLQYEFLTDRERIRSKPVLSRLATVARITWDQRGNPETVIRSSDSWQRMIRKCDCGLTPTASYSRQSALSSVGK